MATWLKVVLIAAGLCFLGLIGMGIFVFLGYQQLTNPVKVRETANLFMTISDPLPSGFNFAWGGNFMDSPFVVIVSPENKAAYTFFSLPQSANTTIVTTPEELVGKIAKEGQAPSSPGIASAKKLKVSSQGTLNIGDQKMPYAIGHGDQAGNGGGTVDNVFCGSIKSSTSGKLVLLMVQSIDLGPTAKPMTIETVKKLTDSITKF
ncbi:MAG: hypothetical protein WCT03_10995 [Candidatus Obscuribacterales bacterium]|jgi:hypothetical protein